MKSKQVNERVEGARINESYNDHKATFESEHGGEREQCVEEEAEEKVQREHCCQALLLADGGEK